MANLRVKEKLKLRDKRSYHQPDTNLARPRHSINKLYGEREPYSGRITDTLKCTLNLGPPTSQQLLQSITKPVILFNTYHRVGSDHLKEASPFRIPVRVG